MITFSWTNQTSPNAMIDILDKCNIKCATCYKRHSDSIKSLDAIKHDLEVAGRLRNLHMVSISGGEPTLHPDLLKVVSLIKSKGYHTAMLTNGILLDNMFLSQLKAAGLDSILFHVDTGQKRPDLPSNPTLKDIRKRLYELIDGATEVDMDVCFSWTILDYSEKEIDFVMNMFLEKRDVSFLFLSKGTDPKSLAWDSIKFNQKNCRIPSQGDDKITDSMKQVSGYFTKKFGISPFSFIPAITSDKEYLKHPLFISYFLPLVYNDQSIQHTYRFESNGMDKLLMYIPKLLKGRFIHKTTQNAKLTGFRVLLNGFSRLRFASLIQFFALAAKQNFVIRNKMIVYDDGPRVLEDGSLAVCEYCPTAIVKNDNLVRCCEIYHKN